MLFNSLQFLLFFGVVTLAYFSLKWQGRWILLLSASCYFYAVFAPKYLLVLFATIVIDYFAGLWIANSKGKVRLWALIISLISNIGILVFFKYANLFIDTLSAVSYMMIGPNIIGTLQANWPNYLLPIGLSFHTFQAMSYTIEVYRGNQSPEKHFGIYALYVMFYPQLVAGPIERPQNVLWQFHTYFAYDWENVKAGLTRMAWGFFKKVVIADRLAMVVDAAYGDVSGTNGLSFLVATVFYSFQIYCDFSGYSDIAIGAARVMGFNLMENFKSPYEAASISEFWRRWHISLSTWFRDYLYIPLGGNRTSEGRRYFNLFFVFMISGLWHGASSWNFTIWGALHGLYLVLAQLRDKFNIKTPELLKMRILNVLVTYTIVMLTWVFFRAMSEKDAFVIIKKILTLRFADTIQTPLNGIEMAFSLVLILFLLWKENRFPELSTRRDSSFWTYIFMLVSACYFLGVFTSNQFIYFQF